jgi:hypothetical protein
MELGIIGGEREHGWGVKHVGHGKTATDAYCVPNCKKVASINDNQF